MKITNIKEEILGFIHKNGWNLENEDPKSDYWSFWKEDNIGIDIDKEENELILIGECGDFLHMELNELSLYTLIGYLLTYRYISIDYKV